MNYTSRPAGIFITVAVISSQWWKSHRVIAKPIEVWLLFRLGVICKNNTMHRGYEKASLKVLGLYFSCSFSMCFEVENWRWIELREVSCHADLEVWGKHFWMRWNLNGCDSDLWKLRLRSISKRWGYFKEFTIF